MLQAEKLQEEEFVGCGSSALKRAFAEIPT